MSTTFILFKPSSLNPFQFQATLDGSIYTVVVTWNLFGQRYYISIYNLNGVLIVSLPMVSSPPSYNISLTKGYFTTQLVWRGVNGQFEVIDQ